MNVLAIETATDLVGAALLRSDGGCVERSHLGGRAHGELLAPAIEEVCATSGCGLDVVDALAVDVGPGLFTGLRVGVATAKALGQALGVGVVGVTSLDTMCAGVLEEGPGDLGRWVVPVVDARRGEVFASAYAVGGPGADTDDPATGRVDRTEALSPEELAGWLVALAAGGGATVVGDGAVRYLGVLMPLDGVDCSRAERLSAPSPSVLARLAGRRLARGTAPTAPVDLVPEYRRHPDARINWEERPPQRTARPGSADGA